MKSLRFLLPALFCFEQRNRCGKQGAPITVRQETPALRDFVGGYGAFATGLQSGHSFRSEIAEEQTWLRQLLASEVSTAVDKLTPCQPVKVSSLILISCS
jgi:hypothetical protein